MAWITYNPKKDEKDGDLKAWLELYRPSEVNSIKGGIEWISVRPPPNEEDGARDFQIRPGLQDSWESLKYSSEPITVQSITEIAIKHNVLAGKWMCYPTSAKEVNTLWEKIATAVVTGSLPPSFTAKVSPRKPGNTKHVILVYNYDYTNEEEVYDLEKALRKLGIECQLLYKPDVYTYCDIYANNKWGLPASLYQSIYNKRTKESKIIKR